MMRAYLHTQLDAVVRTGTHGGSLASSLVHA